MVALLSENGTLLVPKHRIQATTSSGGRLKDTAEDFVDGEEEKMTEVP